MKSREEYERIGKIILDCAFEVHKELGAGFLESVYEECLVFELKKKGLNVENQVYLPVYYKGEKLNKFFRMDVLVEGIIALELKSANALYPIDEFQLVSYMKLADIKLGYLINFNEILLKDGIKRKYNNYYFNNEK
ncbi:MAG: GxxExxY protein [Bacteroidetes bacterium]|nr:GxxExxY protein [Bacteroidota bacterium]